MAPLRNFKPAEPERSDPIEFFEVYDDGDFVIEANTPFVGLKSYVLAAIEKAWIKNDSRCLAWRDAYCGMIVRIRRRECKGCKTGLTK